MSWNLYKLYRLYKLEPEQICALKFENTFLNILKVLSYLLVYDFYITLFSSNVYIYMIIIIKSCIFFEWMNVIL